MIPRPPSRLPLFDREGLGRTAIRTVLFLLFASGATVALALRYGSPTPLQAGVLTVVVLLVTLSQALSALAEHASERRPDLSDRLALASFAASFALGAGAMAQTQFLPHLASDGFVLAWEQVIHWIVQRDGAPALWLCGGALAVPTAICLGQRLRRTRRERALGQLGVRDGIYLQALTFAFPFLFCLSFTAIGGVWILLALAWLGDRIALTLARRRASDAAQALARRVEAGEMSEGQLALLAHLGYAGARELGLALPPHPDLHTWALDFGEFGSEVCVRAAHLATRLVLPVWEDAHPGDARAREGSDAVAAWLEAPEGEHAERLQAAIDRLKPDDLALRAVRDACGAASRGAHASDPPLRFAPAGAKRWAGWGPTLVARDTASALERAAAIAGEPEEVRRAVEDELTRWVLEGGEL